MNNKLKKKETATDKIYTGDKTRHIYFSDAVYKISTFSKLVFNKNWIWINVEAMTTTVQIVMINKTNVCDPK